MFDEMANNAKRAEGLRLARARLSSWFLTAILAVVFALFLKEDTRSTLAFLGLPGLFSAATWQAIAVLVSMVLSLAYAKRVGLDLFGGLILAFGAAVLFSTVYNQGNATVLATKLLPCIATALVVAALAKDHSRNLLQAMFLASIFYVLCNLVFILQRPELIGFDTTESLFFSYRNSTFRVAIPAFVCSLFLDSMDGKKFSVRSVTVYALCLFELLVGYSATAVFAFVLMGFAVALLQLKVFRYLVNGLTIVIGYAFLYVCVVVLRLQDALSFLIEGVLNRTITFTGRTFIWDSALDLLQGKAFLTGYGSAYLYNGLPANGQIFQHAHNEVLNIMLLGGMFAFLPLCIALLLVAFKTFKNRGRHSSSISAVVLLGLSLVALVESVTYPMCFFMLAYAWYDNGFPKR